jgi:hypothetical protein
MLLKKFIKKTIGFGVYFIVLQYLLPFSSPVLLYCYYVSHQNTASVSHDFSNRKSTKLSYDSASLNTEYFHFPKKAKGRFDLGNNIEIAFAFNTITFQYIKVELPYSQIFYSTPLILCNSNRGPPSIF